MNRNNRFFSLFFILFIALSWQLFSIIINNPLFPSITKVMETLVRDIGSGVLLTQLINSLLLIACSLIICLVLSFGLVFLCNWFSFAQYYLLKICSVFNTIPSVAILPLAMLFFGIGDTVIVFLVCFSILWPMVETMLFGYNTINNTYLPFFKNIELNKLQYFLHVVIPALFPTSITAIKVAWGRAFRTIIAVEMIFGITGDNGGIGVYIYKARTNANISKLYAGIICISIVGYIIECVLSVIEKSITERKRD